MNDHALFKLSDGSIILIIGSDLRFFDKKNITFYEPETMLNKYIDFVNNISSKTGDKSIIDTRLVFDKNGNLHIKKQNDNKQNNDFVEIFDINITTKEEEKETISVQYCKFFAGYDVTYFFKGGKIMLFDNIICCDGMILNVGSGMRINRSCQHIQCNPCGIFWEPEFDEINYRDMYTFKTYADYSRFTKNKNISRKLGDIIISPELFRASSRGESIEWIGRMDFKKKDRVKYDLSFKFS